MVEHNNASGLSCLAPKHDNILPVLLLQKGLGAQYRQAGNNTFLVQQI